MELPVVDTPYGSALEYDGDYVTFEEALTAIDRTLFEQGLETFIKWMEQQDPLKELNPGATCGCFLYEYFNNVYGWGDWTVKEDELNEYNLHIYYDYASIPRWYTRFQNRALDSEFRKMHNGNLTFDEAVTIAVALQKDTADGMYTEEDKEDDESI